MPNNNDGQKSSKDSTDNVRDFDFVNPGQSPASSTGAAASKNKKEDDDVATAGGREGNFSDSERDNENEWSPGSAQPSER